MEHLDKLIDKEPVSFELGDGMRNCAQLMVTCLVDAIYPSVGISAVEVLEAQGITVEFPSDQTCCGQPAFNSGYWKDARAMARHTLDVFSVTNGPIVVPSGSCTDMIVHQYTELLKDDAEYLAKAQDVAGRTYELSLIHI
mgnify:FL=1